MSANWTGRLLTAGTNGAVGDFGPLVPGTMRRSTYEPSDMRAMMASLSIGLMIHQERLNRYCNRQFGISSIPRSASMLKGNERSVMINIRSNAALISSTMTTTRLGCGHTPHASQWSAGGTRTVRIEFERMTISLTRRNRSIPIWGGRSSNPQGGNWTRKSSSQSLPDSPSLLFRIWASWR
jgi:hypothetical protein